MELTNETGFGLSAYVCSADLNRTIHVAESLEAGIVATNKGGVSDPTAFFWGLNQSGLSREGDFLDIDEFFGKIYCYKTLQ